jgi:hypothetical protein
MLAALGASTAAFAQYGNDLKGQSITNIAVRLGGVFPIDGRLSDAVDGMFGLGLEYTLGSSLFKKGETYLALDWLTESLSNSRVNIYPLTINQRFFYGESGRRSYGFIGAGAFIIDANRSDTVLGIRGGFGTELGNNIFAEAAVTFADTSKAKIRANTVGVYVGYRF